LEADLRDRPDVLDTLIQAKLAQYARTGKDGGAGRGLGAGGGCSMSHHPDCRAQLGALYAGDTGWRCMSACAQRRVHYWFGLQPRTRVYGPGRLLLQKTIEASQEAGITYINRGEGDNPTKREYGHPSSPRSGLWTVLARWA
jgi:CelD/BcsL family acetyltransferase involved in cellulose biosynthesis